MEDKNDKDIIRQIKSNGATDIAVSPKGKEVAFIMRGDVYVTSIDYKTTKQITNTPQQERDLDFSPDGQPVWRCGVGRAITFLMYFYGYTLCLECLYHRRVMATPLGIKGVAMLKYCI